MLTMSRHSTQCNVLLDLFVPQPFRTHLKIRTNSNKITNNILVPLSAYGSAECHFVTCQLSKNSSYRNATNPCPAMCTISSNYCISVAYCSIKTNTASLLLKSNTTTCQYTHWSIITGTSSFGYH